MSEKKPVKNAGFTLLEVMLVLVLIGMASTMIIPRLPSGSGAAQLNHDTEKLAALIQLAQETALINGRNLGFGQITNDKTGDGYLFLELEAGGWTTIKKNRFMKKVALPDDMVLTLRKSNSFWLPALEYEATTDIKITGSRQIVRPREKKSIKPDLIFWSSGEITPAELTLCVRNKKELCRRVIMEETGEIHTLSSDA